MKTWQRDGSDTTPNVGRDVSDTPKPTSSAPPASLPALSWVRSILSGRGTLAPETH